MKTEIKTTIAICVLAFAGILNAGANSNFEEKNLALVTGNNNLATVNEKLARINEAVDFQSEAVDYQKEAQLVTKWIADIAETEATQQVFERNAALTNEVSGFAGNVVNDDNNEVTDFRKEAQLVTKTIADRKEANAVQKLVNEGRIAENR